MTRSASPAPGRTGLDWRVWDRARALLQVLFACRVSLGAVLVPLGMFLYSPAARDLFWFFARPLTGGEGGAVGPRVGEGEVLTLLFWSVFVAFTALFWTYPVHFSARIILNYPEWLFGRRRAVTNAELEDVHRIHGPFIIWLPRVLGTSTFAILAYAAYLSLGDLPDRAIYEALPPGPTEAGETAREMTGILRFLVAAFCAFTVATGIWFAWRPGRGLGEGRRPGDLAPGDRPLRARYRQAIGDEARIKDDVLQGKVILTIVTMIFLLVLFGPNLLGNHVFLALLLPLIFGAWVPALTLVAYWGHRVALPLMTIGVGVVVLLSYLSGDRHDISRADASARTGPQVGFREGFAASVERWKRVNCGPPGCPRPIVLSTAGGASRAAFFTSTVLGDLLDNPGNPDLGARGVADRIFAVSAVSGGSVGAAFFAAALANSPTGRQPCREEPSDRWFRSGRPINWRDCLQILTSEDYLSDTILGLVFRDNFSFASRFLLWPDRAARLEQAWTEAFERHVRPAEGQPLLGLSEPFTRFGPTALGADHWQPLLVLNGTSVSTGRRILTSHIAPTGGRTFLDAYDLYEILSGKPACDGTACPDVTPRIPDVTLASAATNSARFPVVSPAGTMRVNPEGQVADRIVDGGYFENDGMTTTIDVVRALRDAGLNPAVLHIANDPLPYPRSSRQAEGDRRGTDTAVAGPPDGRRVVSWRTDSPVAPSAEDKSWFLLLRAPLGSLLATRSARASYAITAMQDEVPGTDSFAEIQVYGELRDTTGSFVLADDETCIVPPAPPKDPRYKQVSMSWWLSQPVQQYLDTQLVFARNCDALRRVRGWLSEPRRPLSDGARARR